MEAIFSIIGFIILYVIAMKVFGFISTLLSSGTKAVISSGKTIVKSGFDIEKIKENFKDDFYRMGPLEIRCVASKFPVTDGEPFDGYQIQVRGIINTLQNSFDACAVISLVDFTDGKYEPVLTNLDFLQEKNTSAFQRIIPIGKIDEQVGYQKWVNLERVIPAVVYSKRSGNRHLKVLVRFIPNTEEQINRINLGLHQDESIFSAFGEADLNVVLEEKGYEESREEQIRARALMIMFAVYVANIDGNLDAKEAKTIQKWIAKQVEIAYENMQEKLKKSLNDALKESYKLAQNDKLSISNLIKEFKDLTTYATNLSLMEFLIEIIGADSKVTKEEMKAINSIADSLGIDQAQVKSMSEKSFLSMKSDLKSSSSLESILGIDESWAKEEVMKHLSKEFSKWNGRIQALQDEDEKNKAQQMLDAIAKARKKYGK